MQKFSSFLLSLILVMPALGADKDKPLPKDFKALKALAEKGDAEAQARLANFYYWGKGVKVDRIEAYKWASRSAKQGNPIASYHVASAHFAGVGIPQDTAKAELLYKEAAPGLLALAKQGNAYAQFCLSDMYAEGRGVNRNEKEGFQWMLKAAKQNLPEAQIGIGVMYMDGGGGVKKDEKEALMWMRKAADQNLLEAKAAIGVLLIEGKLGVKKNAEKGLQLVKESVEQGSLIGMFMLGSAYISKEMSLAFGVEFDAEKGLKLIRASANQGLSNARYIQALLLLVGQLGVQKDVEKGMKLMRTAAAQKNAKAQHRLARFYFTGQFGVEKDVKTGLKLMHKFAEEGNTEAQNELKYFYFEGDEDRFGVKADWVLAYAWAHIAAANGQKVAKRDKETLANEFLTPEQLAKAEAMVKEMTENNPRLLK